MSSRDSSRESRHRVTSSPPGTATRQPICRDSSDLEYQPDHVDLDKSALFESVRSLRVPSELPYDVIYTILEFLDRPRDIWHFAQAIFGTKYRAYVKDMIRILYRRDIEFQQEYLLSRPDKALEYGPPALLWAAKGSRHSTMRQALEATKRIRDSSLYIDGLNILPYRPKPRQNFDCTPRPPLLVCAGRNDVRGCQLLLEYGADINIRWLNHRDGRIRPWRSEDDSKSDRCFRGTHKHCPHYSGMCLTAVSHAASRGCVGAVKYLVRAGAETKSAETVPPLHMAVMKDQVHTVQALLKIDPTLANFRTWRHGSHPLTVATDRYVPTQDVGYVRVPSLNGARICSLLLEHGAYVDARADGEVACNTPLVYAAKNGFRCAEARSYSQAMLWAIYCAILLRAGASHVLSEDMQPQVSETKGPASSEVLQWLNRNAKSRTVQDRLRAVGPLTRRH